jgi:hypothetical protein
MAIQCSGLGLDIELAQLGSARLGLARYPNELAQLGSLSLTSSKASSARLVKKLGSARLARELSTWTCNRMIIYRCYITYLSIKHTYITYLSIKHTYITYLSIKHIKQQANNEIEYELGPSSMSPSHIHRIINSHE